MNSTVNQVDNILGDVNLLITNISNIEEIKYAWNFFLDDIEYNIFGLESKLGENLESFQRIRSRYLNIVHTISNNTINIDPFKEPLEDFRTLSNTIVNTSLSKLEDASSMMETGFEAMNANINNINSSILSFRDKFEIDSVNIFSQVESILNRVDAIKESIANKDRLSFVQSIFMVSEVVIGTIVVLLLAMGAISLSIGLIAILSHSSPTKNFISIVSSIGILYYGALGTIFMIIISLTNSFCANGISYYKDTELIWELPQFNIAPLIGHPVSFSYFDLMNNVLECPNNGSIVDALGIDLQLLGIPQLMYMTAGSFERFNEEFKENVIIDMINNKIKDIKSNITIAEEIEPQIYKTQVQLNESISNYFSLFPLNLALSDFEQEDETLNQVNLILSKYGYKNISATDSINFSPYYYATIPPTPGKIVELGEGSKFNSLYSIISNSKDRNELWGNLARNGMNIEFAPGPIQLGYFSLLTRLNAPPPFYSKFIYIENLNLQNDLKNLSKSIYETQNQTKLVLSFENHIENIVGSMKNISTYAEIYSKEFIYNTLNKIEDTFNEIRGNFSCQFVGSIYQNTKSWICGGLNISLIVHAIFTVIMELTLFFGIFIIIISQFIPNKN